MIDGRERLRFPWVVLSTIRLRLTLWYVALLAIVLLGFSTFLYASLSRKLYAELDHRLRTEKQRVIDELNLDKESPDLDDLQDLPTGLVVALYDHTGGHLIDGNTPQPLPVPPEALTRVRQGQEVRNTIRLADGTQWRALITPVSREGHLIGVLHMASSERDIAAALDQLVALIVIAIPLTLLLAIGGGLFLAGRALGPIDRITRSAEQIEAEDLSRRLNLPWSPDEVGRLAATFDRMLDRLDRAFQRQRQFTADASHELRTPLAMLISQADIALEWHRSAEEYRQVIASIREEAARMGRLLDELLTLARADAGQQELILEPLALHDLVDDVVKAMALLAEARGVCLEGRAPVPMTVEGDQTRITQLLVNLIDNGLKYTPAGGVVTVSLERASHWAELRVMDTGVGISAEHLPHVFERFYRVDPARSRAEGGAGLGLSICQWIARAHGGDITVTSQAGRGTIFTVCLPLENQRTSDGESASPKHETQLV
jgi:heavy metal sensor kinase